MRKDNIRLLMSLGFNQLEAEIYTLLLSQEPITAYRAGKLLGKPTANVYKAIDSLASKGALIVEEGTNRLCRAIAPKEFLNLLKKDFLQKTEEVSDSLSNLKPEIYDERIYEIKSLPLILEKTNNMLKSCKTIAVIDAFPKPLNAILPSIDKLIKRGVDVYVQAYESIEIEGAHVAVTHQFNEVLKHWKSQQLNVVIDGREHLIALFNDSFTNVYQATWSRNLYLSCMLHAGFIREHTIHKLMAVKKDRNMIKNINEILTEQKFFFNSLIPGQKELYNRYNTLDSEVQKK